MGGGGGGGKGPFVHKGALPPRHIMQQYTVIACLFFGREAFFHKRLPSPNLSLPKNFTGSLAGQFGPARRRVAAMSPGGMTNRRLDGNSRPVCLVVQVLAGLWASVALQVTTAEVWTSKVFGGMGGGGGKGPFVHKGALPPTKKKQTPPPPKNHSVSGGVKRRPRWTACVPNLWRRLSRALSRRRRRSSSCGSCLSREGRPGSMACCGGGASKPETPSPTRRTGRGRGS